MDEECIRCGAFTMTIIDDSEAFEIRYSCSSCGYEAEDCYSDLYGMMAVPWGFLL